MAQRLRLISPPMRKMSDLIALKQARHPDDDRIIVDCGITPENNVRVEWRNQNGVVRG